MHNSSILQSDLSVQSKSSGLLCMWSMDRFVKEHSFYYLLFRTTCPLLAALPLRKCPHVASLPFNLQQSVKTSDWILTESVCAIDWTAFYNFNSVFLTWVHDGRCRLSRVSQVSVNIMEKRHQTVVNIQTQIFRLNHPALIFSLSWFHLGSGTKVHHNTKLSRSQILKMVPIGCLKKQSAFTFKQPAVASKVSTVMEERTSRETEHKDFIRYNELLLLLRRRMRWWTCILHCVPRL